MIECKTTKDNVEHKAEVLKISVKMSFFVQYRSVFFFFCIQNMNQIFHEML